MRDHLTSTLAHTTRALGSAVVLLALATACGGDQPTDVTPAANATREPTTPTGPPDGLTIVPDGGSLPDGVYRVAFDDDHLAAHGLDGIAVANNRGVWTTTLDDGRWTVEQVGPDITDRFEGVYQVVGDHLYWRFHDTLEVLHLTWSTDDEGDLHFTQVTDTGRHDDFQFALPWTRVDRR